MKKYSRGVSMQFDKDKDVQILSEEYCYQGFFNLKKVTLRHQLFAGGWSQAMSREIFDHKPDAAALPYDPHLDKVILIQQFRAGAMENTCPWLYEAVAGIADDDDLDVEQVITRELREESGLEPKQLLKIHEYWVSPGSSNEYLTLFIAQVDASQAGGIHGLPEEHEDIYVHVISAEEAFTMLDQGLLNNALTIIAVQWLRLHRERLQAEWCDR
jgi:ADP-ribose pyrophosphatase